MRYLLALAFVSTATASPSRKPLWVASVFPPAGVIPREFTCDGAERAPPLVWSGTPDGTARFAIVVSDADDRRPIWKISVPANVNAIEGAPDDAIVDEAWQPPCPPRGHAHHYVFRVSALDAHGHVLASGDVLGIYAHD